MITREIDARGWLCPKPVIETRALLAELSEGIVIIHVDNATARENLLRLAERQHLVAESTANEQGFDVKITKTCGCELEDLAAEAADKNWVVVLTADTLGRGSEELGGILMNSFLFALSQLPNLPQTLILMNGGVKLAAGGAQASVLESLTALGAGGCEIMACGTCLDYFNLKEDLQVGHVSNMYDIVEAMQQATLLTNL